MVYAVSLLITRTAPRINDINAFPVGFSTSLFDCETIDKTLKLLLEGSRIERYTDSPVGILRMEIRNLQRQDDCLTGSCQTSDPLNTLYRFNYSLRLMLIQISNGILDSLQASAPRILLFRIPLLLSGANRSNNLNGTHKILVNIFRVIPT
ncbi:hypothetical protein C7E19_24105, partial [Stenotrophomonas maltophilia]